MGCGCGKSFSTYATGTRTVTSHMPQTRPVPAAVNIQSKSLQAKRSVQTSVAAAQNSGRRKV